MPQPVPWVIATIAVDVRVLGQHLGRKPLGDELRHRGRAVHGRQDADVVARADLAVAAHEAAERAPLRLGYHRDRPHVLPDGVVAGELAHAAIVHMDVLARCDVLGREADDLVELADRLAERDRPRRHLVPGGNALGDGQPFPVERRAGQDVDPGDHDIVVRVQADGERGRGHVALPLFLSRLIISARPRPATTSGNGRRAQFADELVDASNSRAHRSS